MSVSPWFEATSPGVFSRLLSDVQTDVCVVGGGLAGILTARLLQKQGKKVCVLEMQTVGSGQTGRTTAHVTDALDDRYFLLEQMHGRRGIELAAESHQSAIDMIEHLATLEAIECDLQRVRGYLFLDPTHTREHLIKELAAIHRAGLKDVHEVESIPGIPTLDGPAICFPNQIQFHPLKFLMGVAQNFVRDGGEIYTGVKVVEVKGGEQALVTTESGCKVTCKSVVVATNSPINDLFAIHTKQAPYRTYAISARIPKNSIPYGLYWDTLDPYHYVRVQPNPSDDLSEILIVGGEDHKTGQNDEPEACYGRLEKWMRERFPQTEEIVHQWSGQVMEPVDGLAFLGHNPMDKNNVYVITGDSGNGMTHATIGAMLVTDQILGRPNPWEALYEPSRKNLRSLQTFVKENSNVAAQYLDWFQAGEIGEVDEIPRGEGAILRDGVHLVACYRDNSGGLSTCSATCPHLAGVVRWNSAEKTWDCPCHGSRFDARGKVIEGPAFSDLKSHSVEHKAPMKMQPVLFPNMSPGT